MHFLLDSLLAITLPQIILAYTIPSDTEDPTELQSPDLGGNGHQVSGISTQDWSDWTNYGFPSDPADSQQPLPELAEPNGACKGYLEPVHVTCKGPEVDTDPPGSYFQYVLNCMGGKSDFFYSLEKSFALMSFPISWSFLLGSSSF